MEKQLQQMEQETMAMHKGSGDAADGNVADGANRADGAVVASNGEAESGAGAAAAGQLGAEGFSAAVDGGTAESDARSIYVGNVRRKLTSNIQKNRIMITNSEKMKKTNHYFKISCAYHLGGLQSNGRRTKRILPGMRDDKPGNNNVSQGDGATKRIRLHRVQRTRFSAKCIDFE